MSSSFTLQFVGIGPQRTGSSWLHEVLESHPDLCLPNPIKETMFFDRYYNKGFDWYQSQFSSIDAQHICGEIGPTYFQSQEVRDRIFQHSPNCKIIVSVRNPIEHIFSLYLHEISKGLIRGTFSEAIDNKASFLNAGHYSKFVPQWQSVFGRSQVKYVWMDQIKRDPKAVFTGLCEFLEVPVCDYPVNIGIRKINSAKYPRFPLLSRVGVGFYHFLRAHRLHRVLMIAKRFRLDRVTFSQSVARRPDLTVDDRYRLLEIYEDDIAFLETECSVNLDGWRQKILGEN